MNEQSPSFAEALLAERKRLHLSRTRVARLLGCHVDTIKRWEKGDYAPTPEKQAAALKALFRFGNTLGETQAAPPVVTEPAAPQPEPAKPLPANPTFDDLENYVVTPPKPAPASPPPAAAAEASPVPSARTIPVNHPWPRGWKPTA